MNEGVFDVKRWWCHGGSSKVSYKGEVYVGVTLVLLEMKSDKNEGFYFGWRFPVYVVDVASGGAR